MKKFMTLLFAIALFAVAIIVPQQAFAEEAPTDYMAEQAYVLLKDFVETCPSRSYDTAGEKAAAEYVAAKFTEILGSGVEIRTIPETANGNCANVIATIAANNSSAHDEVIIGAHYDSVYEGASDNAAGVVALFMLAEKLKDADLPFAVRLIAFGGEEAGFVGSYQYISSLPTLQVGNIMLMINIDTICSGDHLYVFTELFETPYQKAFTDASAGMPSQLLVKPYAKGIYPQFDVYGMGYWQFIQQSDHTPFRMFGVPTVLFFSGNYDGYGYVESSDQSKILANTANDTLEKLEATRGGEFVNRINTVVGTVYGAFTAQNFYDTARDARSALPADALSKLWIPRVIALGLALALAITIAVYYKKLQKKALLDDGDDGTKGNTGGDSRVFKEPDADEIFKY